MFNQRTRKRLYICLTVAVCLSMLVGVSPAAAGPDPGSPGPAPATGRAAAPLRSARSPEQTGSTSLAPAASTPVSGPGNLASADRRVSCDLYPIALHTSSLVGVEVGAVVPDILNGGQPGNFGWLTWAGNAGVPALVASLTPPGNSQTYVNPEDPADNLVSIGDWVPGRPGVATASSIRAALDQLTTLDISVPVWDASEGGGVNVRYRVSNFAKVRLLSYNLARQNRITVRFLGYDPTCGDNLAPIAASDVYTTEEDTTLTIPAPGVLANDTDPNLDPISSLLITGTLNGDLALALDGSFVYTPTTNFNGADYFFYRASDGELLSITTTVTITVTPVNDSPVALDDAYEVDQGQTLTVPVPGVLVNDSDVDGDPLNAVLDAGPAHGTLTLNTDGSFVYTPVASFSGEDSFTYLANDGALDSNIATVTIIVTSTGLPDLAIPTLDRSGTTTNFQALRIDGEVVVELANLGPQNVMAPFEVSVFEDSDGNGLWTSGVDSLLGQAMHSDPLSAGSSASLTVPVAGSVLFRDNLLYAFVDSGQVIQEEDETNNYANSGQTCEFTPTSCAFDPALEWSWTSSNVMPTSLNVMMTPGVVDLNGDDIPDVVFGSTASTGGASVEIGVLRALDGRTGAELFTVTDPSLRIDTASSIAIGDIDQDNLPEVVATDATGYRLIAFENDGTFKWRSPNLENIYWGTPALADLDADNRPEIIVGRQVLNNDGSVRWTGTAGRATQDNAHGPVSLVADVDMNGIPDIVAGNTVYFADGTINWHASLTDGYNGVANFDEDEYPEIVLVTNGNVYLLEHTGAVKWGPIPLPEGGRGGPPTVADFDSDGQVEIGVAAATRYVVLETDGSIKWTAVTRDRSSEVTGSSVFDFNGDGSAEVVYRDEYYLHIYRGTDGSVLFETPMTSCTWFEYVLVADVDADGNAELVAVANNNCGLGPQRGIYVYGSENDCWVSTRQIWNQHTYHITNVNDDGTIPAIEANNWETYNNYRQNVQTEGSVFAAPDLTASYLRSVEENGLVTITARIGNGGAQVADDVSVAFYLGDPASGGSLLGTSQVSAQLDPGEYEDVSIEWSPSSSGTYDIYAVADDDGTVHGRHNECDEENNVHHWPIEVTVTPAVCVMPPSGMVAWWPGDGNTFDLVGSHHGTLVNGAGYAEGFVGPTYQFEGSQDHVTAAAPGLVADSYTIEMWANPHTLPAGGGFGGLFQLGDALSGDQALTLENNWANLGRVGFTAISYSTVGPQANNVIDVGSLPEAGQWYHIAMVRNVADDSLKLYVNGQEAASDELIGVTADYGSNDAVQIGTRYIPVGTGPNLTLSSFLGLLDEVSVYERALTADEIATVYLAGTAGKCKPENSIPIAVNDSYEVDGCGILSVTQPGLLANDTDADGDALTAALVTAPLSGALILDPDGSFVYTPTIGFHGTYTFTYTASDGLSTSLPATASISVIPPTESQIVFQSNPDGNWEIYSLLVDVVGDSVQVAGGPYRLTNNAAPDEYPTLSQDGRHVAFNSRRDGNDELYILDLENAGGVIRPASPERRLTNDPAQDWRPAWSPDGNWLVFAYGGIARGVTAIRSDDTDGSSRTRLTSAPGGHDWMTWSPDGKSIAYIYNGYTPYNSIITSFPVTVTDSTVTAGPERTVSSGPYDDSADWSPNGDRILFTSWRDTGSTSNNEIYLVDADGTNEHRLTTSSIHETLPAWSPDGSKIAYATNHDGNTDLYVMDLADTTGANVVRLTTNSAQDLLNRGAWACRPPETSNEAPVAADDVFSTAADQILTVPAPGILGNDSDPDGDALTTILVSDVSHGALTLNPDGSFVYSPAAGFSGEDSFTYKANDGALDSNVATVTITITPPLCNVGPWSSVPDLVTARYTHQTVLLDNGKVLVAGGTQASSAAGDDLASTEIYDPATNTWEAGPSMSAARTGFSATVLPGGRVLVAGGEHFGVATTSTEIYDPITNTWSPAASMSIPRAAHTATLLRNGAILVAGGGHTGTNLAEATAEIYDPQTNQWTPVASMATARLSHTATLLSDGRVLVTGGNPVQSSWTSLSSAELYDPDSNTWSSVPDMSISRAVHTATLLNDGRVLVVGGEGVGPSARASADVYDPATNTWSPIASMAAPRSRHTATLLPAGKVLVAGGWSQSGGATLSTAELYDPTTNTWTTATNLDHARNLHTATLLCNGKVLFVGGAIWSGGWVAIGSAELYDPQPASAAPVAVDDTYSVNQDQTLTVPAPGLLENDTDPDGDPLTAVRVSDPIHGALTLSADGSFTYTPSPGYVGADQFTYKANDGTLDSNVAIVSITVSAPVCNAGNWSSIPDLVTARYEHEAVLLGNGRVLVAGGTQAGSSAGDDFASTELYDPATNTWVVGPSMNTPRTGHSATVLADGRVLVAGGEHLGVSTTSAEIYDPVANTWSPAATMGIPRAAHTATLLHDGKVLVVGGGQSGNNPAEVSAEIYDPQANQWTFVASFSTPRHAHTATLLNDGRVLVVGGNPIPWNYTSTSKAEVYDPQHNTWLSVPDMSVARARHTATLLDTGQVLVAGGEGAGPTALTNAELYDPATNSWLSVPAMMISRSRHSATLLSNGQVAVAGGTPMSGPSLDSVELFDPTSNAWLVAQNLETGRDTHTATLLCNGRILMVGGWTPLVALAAVELYDPLAAPDNTAPLAADDVYQTIQDQTLTVPAPGVLENDTDPDGDPLTAARVSDPIHGALTLNADGSFTYEPSPGYSGLDQFTYRANDGVLDSNIATVTITVEPAPNRPPAAVDDSYGTLYETSLTIAAPGVLDNDSDPDGNPITAALVSDVSHGTLTLEADGGFSYTPAGGFSGEDSFTYRASDGSLTSDLATVTISVGAPPNRPPVAVDDSYSTQYETSLTIAAPGVLANDSDPDDDPLAANLVSNVTHGALTLNADGSFEFAPEAGYSGADQFTYRANDGVLDSNIATVTITVGEPDNRPPVANDDTGSVDEDEVLTVAAPGVLGNDSDPDNDPLTAVLVSNPAHGALTLNADGSYVYTPAPDFNGADSFTYQANDGELDSNIATVTLAIAPVNDAPVAADYELDVPEDNTLVVAAPGVLNLVYDVDGDPLTARVGSPPAHGVLDLQSTGDFEYTPAPNYHGTDSFTFIANDGQLDSNPGTITIVVTPLPDAPVAANDAYSMDGGATLTIAAPGVLANDSDPDGDALTAVLAAGPGHGTLALNPDGSFSYTPAAGFSGADSFTYRASDGALTSNVATVSITVGGPPNRPPVAVDDAYSAASDQTLTVDPPGVLDNDSDPDGNSLTAILVSDVAHGTLTLNANGSFGYTPTAGYAGPDSFTYTANDGLLDSNVASVAITVVAPPAAPPTAQITSPTEGTRVTSATNIVGTASSTALASYRLEHRLVEETGGGAWTSFASGNTSVTNGTLGVLDPTLLINGIYEVRLTAIDVVGQFASVSTTVVVEGQQKIGIFTLSFTDLEVPLSGIPIQVTRTYDSRDKVKHDFGVGWTLDISTARVQENKVLGQNWQGTVSGGLFPNYCIVPTRPNVVTITLPGGSVFRFEPVLSPGNGCQQLVPLSEVTISYRPLAGTNASLAPVGSSTFQVVGSFPGDIELWDLGGAAFADFDRYQLTLYDGRRLTIDQQAGLESIRDISNNTLTITSGGITHSSGQSVSFTRDGQGRITQITDPAGKTIAYAYDGNGDLVRVTDQGGNVTQFVYGAAHYLQDILDPRGVQAIRSEYDEDGRLIRVIDAEGNDITYEHQLAANTELVTNRLGDQTAYQYDSRGNVTQQTDALGNVTSYTFDERDNQLSETDPLGRTTTFTYDASDNLLTTTDPLGNVTRYTYNSRGQVLTNTDALGRVTSNTYDANGNLLTTTDPLGKTTSYTYDTRGNRTSMTDALNQTTHYEYDSLGRMTREVDALGHAVTYTYDAIGNRLSETRTRSVGGGSETLVTTYEYDDLNRLVRTTYPDGSTTQTEYNAIGQQSATVDPLGRRTTYEYDLSGRLVRTIYPDGASEQSTYDAEGRTATSVDRLGRTTAFTYDALGRLERTTYPGGAFTTTTYDDAGQTIATTDELGHSTSYGYDDAGRRSSVTDALGHSTAFTYDANGNQLTMTDANGHTVSYEYDRNSRRTRTIFADGTSQTTTYDDLGRRVAETDQAGKTTQFGYDSLGRLTSVTDALGQVTRYTYDEVGNQLTQTDANGHTTRFAYDSMGRRTSRTLPLGMAETYAYDAAGNMTGKTDFNGKTTTYGYDAVNRLLSKTPDPSFGQPDIVFTYFGSGQRQSMTDPSGVTTYTYDARDRLLTKATPFGTLTYAYDDAGNLTSIHSSNVDGVSVDYTYDALNRLATATDNTLASGVTTYSYDDVGNLASYLYPNGVEHSYRYDSLNRLTDLAVHNGPTMLASYAYSLGPAGNRLSVAELSGRTVTYAYDDLYRLLGETIAADPNGTNGAIGYTYDPVGNRLARTSSVAPVPPSTYGYDANDRLLSDAYDDNGNTVGSDGHTYTYDFENRLVSYDDGAVTMVYDGDGNRVAKTVAGVTTNYLVDDRNLTGYAQVLEEIASGSVQRKYMYGLDLVNQKQVVGGIWTASFYVYDGHGSVRKLSDERSGLTNRYEYDAFGGLVWSLSTLPNNYLHSGEQFDSDLGSYYLRARFYDESTGRFLTVDPISGSFSEPATLHKYVFASNNPVTQIDPTGEYFLVDVAITTILIGALIITTSSPVRGANFMRKEAWDHKHTQWNSSDERRFGQWIKENWQGYKNRAAKEDLDCASFTIALLVDFASAPANGLPVVLIVGGRKYDSRDTSLRNTDLFRRRVVGWSSANEVFDKDTVDKGTVLNNIASAQQGYLMMRTSQPMGHTRIFLDRVYPDDIGYIQSSYDSMTKTAGPITFHKESREDVAASTPSLKWWENFVFGR